MLQRAGDGRAVAGVRLHAEHRVRAEQLGQRRPAAVPAAGVNADGAVHRMGLLAHRLHQPRQEPGTVVRDHYSGDDVTEMRCVLWQGSCLVRGQRRPRSGYPSGESAWTT